MCGLQVLLTIVITMATTLEGRSILRQTDRRSNLNVQGPYHQIQYNNNIRGFRLQRPNFPPNVISNFPRRDSPLQHMNWQIQTNHADTDDIHTTWQVRSRGTLLPSNNRRHFGFPLMRRVGRLMQRIPQFNAHRNDADRSSVSLHQEDLSKRTDGRKVNINLALNPKDSINGHVISVKAGNIGNIRLSHAATRNAVIDLHNEGHRTRFTFSRKFQKTPVKAETTNGQNAETQNTKVTDVSKQAVMNKSIVSDVANSTSSPLTPTATLSSLTVASSSISSSIKSTTTSLLPGDVSSTPAAEIQSTGNHSDVMGLNVTNIVQINQTAQADTSADKTQTSADKTQTSVDKSHTQNVVASELPISSDVIPGHIVSTPKTTELFRDRNSVAMSTIAYGVTTEEPDVGDAPDVDSVRNSFYADQEYD